MTYTKASEKDDTVWSLLEFISLRGNFSILKEETTNRWYGSFSNKGTIVYTHIERKVRGTSISYILNHQDEYKVIVAIDEYCLYKAGDIIDYSTIAADSDPSISQEDFYYTAQDYYRDNSDIFLGEII